VLRLAASSRVGFAVQVPLRAEWPMARAELRRRAEACGPQASLAPHSELRAAIPAAPGQVGFQVAFAARLPLVEAEVAAAPFVPDASLDASEAHLPRVESREAAAFAWDVPGARPQVAAVAQAESGVQAQPAAPGAVEVPQPVEARAWDARAVPPWGAVVARRAEAVQEAVARLDAVVQRPVVEVAPGAAAALRPAAARHAVEALRPAEARPDAPAVVQAAAPSAAASACRQGRPRPALARRPAARSVHEMWHLQTASRREQSSQAAQDEVWS
jgi:hypothetical protein